MKDVRQLVSQQPLSFGRPRRVLSLAESNVPTDRVGPGIDCLSRLGRAAVGVNLDAAEVVTEAELHEVARLRVERLTGRAQYFIDDGRGLLLALRTLPAAGAFPLQWSVEDRMDLAPRCHAGSRENTWISVAGRLVLQLISMHHCPPPSTFSSRVHQAG